MARARSYTRATRKPKQTDAILGFYEISPTGRRVKRPVKQASVTMLKKELTYYRGLAKDLLALYRKTGNEYYHDQYENAKYNAELINARIRALPSAESKQRKAKIAKDNRSYAKANRLARLAFER